MHAQTKLGPNITNLIGTLPTVSTSAPAFTLTANDMSDKTPQRLCGPKCYPQCAKH